MQNITEATLIEIGEHFTGCSVLCVCSRTHTTEVEGNTSNHFGLKTQVACRNIRNQ